MKYIVVLILIIAMIYTFSYAKYSKENGNKMAAAGAIIIAMVAIILPAVLMFK